jgi:hypothetical protein
VIAIGSVVLAAVLAWPRVAQAAGPYQFYPVTPCRIVDTRNPDGPVGGPVLTAGAYRNFPIWNYCGIPTTARAAALNVVAVSPTQDGFISIWPYNTPFPGTAILNTPGGIIAIANGAIVPLAIDFQFNVTAVYGTAGGGTSHLVIDVTGYYQ